MFGSNQKGKNKKFKAGMSNQDIEPLKTIRVNHKDKNVEFVHFKK